jgi:hypothetical protein
MVPEPPVAVKVMEEPWHTGPLVLRLGVVGMGTISAEAVAEELL